MSDDKDMKIITDASTITPIVRNMDSVNANIGDALIRYDQNLLNKISADIHVVREYGLAAANALDGTNQLEFAQRLKHFKLALKSHLKKVGVKLYVYLRCELNGELNGDPRAASLSEFEEVITRELQKVAEFLTKAKSVDWSERQTLKPQLLTVLDLLLKIHEKEKRFLFPVYMECADKQLDTSHFVRNAVAAQG